MELSQDLLRSFFLGASCKDGTKVITTTGAPLAEQPLAPGEVPPEPAEPKKVPKPKPPLSDAFYTTPEDPLDKYAPVIVRGAVIGTGLVGLAVFARSIRLFTRFEHARQIPEDFIRKGVRLQGRVSTVEPDGTLRVAHQPLARLPRLLSRGNLLPGLLTVRLAGLEISGEGTTFLRQNLGSEFAGNGRTVWFTLIHRPLKEATDDGKDEIQAEVTTKLGKLSLLNYNLNQELVRRGLARIPSTGVEEHVKLLRSSPAYSRLINQLLISERIADRRGVGMWQRETWVEGMQALPSQMGSMVTNTSVYRLLVLLGLGAKNILVTTTRVGIWTAKKTPDAVSAVASGTRTAVEGGTKIYVTARTTTGKVVAVTRSVWQRLIDSYLRLLSIYQGIRRRLTPKTKA